jgi:hypothetical protein
VPSARIVEAFDELEDGDARVGSREAAMVLLAARKDP